MRKTFFILFLLFSFSTLYAQDRISISGSVVDASGITLPGVSVMEKGTTNGVVTDIDGNYTLSVNQGADVIFSYIGFLSQEINPQQSGTINIQLQEDVVGLEEVVVVGYGSMKKADLTSSISTMKADELVKTPAGQAMESLQGKVAGVQIVNSGSPGSSPTVRIRGVGSFPGSSNSAPLYVVDGMYFDNIDFLNPSDIETLSVLKDASASAIYGVRAANGVVLITTKKGSLNTKTSITYDGYYGIQVPQNVMEMANAEQFVDYIYQTGSEADISFIENAISRYGSNSANPNVPNVNTDWYGEIMKSHARQQNHSLSILGGNDKTSYSMGVNYYDQEGLLEAKDSYKRMNIRASIDHQANNWLKTGVNFNISNGTRYIAEEAAWFEAYHAVPTLPVYDQQNYDELVAQGIDFPSNYSSAQLLEYRSSQNPFLELAFNENRQDIRKLLAGIYAEIELIPNMLTFKSTYNSSMMFLKARNVGMPYYITNSTRRPLSTIESSRTTDVNHFIDNTISYVNSFGDHNVSAMAGMSYRDEWHDFLRGDAEDIPLNENAWYINQSQSETSKQVSDDGERLYGISYFGRLSYNYNNKYIAYFTIRQEGTQKYQEKWGTFPAFGLGWVVTEESFMENVDFLNYLKIRGGWGKLGNDKIDRQDGANTTNPIYLAIDDTQVDGTTTTSTFGYLGWEIVTGTNIGLNAELFDNRLSIDADYFIRDTEDAAIPVSLKLQSGSVLRNVGTIRNSGLELAASWRGEINRDFSYTIGGNISKLKNEVRDLYGQQYINDGQAEFRQRSQVGEPLLSFYGYEVAGVYQNQSEIDADPIAVDNSLVPGDFKYVDQNNDYAIDDNDKVFLGSFIPTFTYGGFVGLNYKDFEFSMNFMGQTGNKILNRKRGEIIWTNDANIDADLANGLWNGEGTSNKYPSASGLRRGWNQNFSDYLVEDGNFFRIQNIQIAYNIDGKKLIGEGMPDARIFITAEKPLTVFKYNGFNPEVEDGIDRQFYPVPAVYTIGVNLKF